MVLARNRENFRSIGVEVLAPSVRTAELCFDKFKMFEYLKENGINTVMTWGSYADAEKAIMNNEASFPIFIKPRTGSGSVGAKKVVDLETLKKSFLEDDSLIAQEYMDGQDLDADIYIDTISHLPV